VTVADERLGYLRSIVANRGYAHRSHRLLATHDLAVLRALDRIPLANYVIPRLLDGATKELVLIAAFVSVRAGDSILAAHIRKAHALGATPRQTLDCILLMLPEAGAVACAPAIATWAELCPLTERETPMPQPDPAAGRLGAATARLATPSIAEAVEGLRHAAEEAARSLDTRTKGLIGVVALACLKAPRPMLEARLREALAGGATPVELLQALELIITPAGLPVFDAALAAWAEVTGAEELDPTGEGP
jgi:alkylhydroperoxidase/carboxymuconolactone decarboxylase family protein YurZ